MAQSSRKRAATSTAQSSSKRARNQDGGNDDHDETRLVQRRISMNDDGVGESNEQDGEEFSTQAISELETHVTTLIRNTGKNDGWPAAFKQHVHGREKGLLEKLAAGMAERDQAEESFHTSFLPFLAGCLARVGLRPLDPHPRRPRPRERPFPIPDPSPHDQPLFHKSSTLIQQSQTLLKDYNDLVDVVVRVDSSSSRRERLLATLAREEDALGDAIRAGRREVRAEIAALLGYKVDQSVAVAGADGRRRGSDVLRVGAQEVEAKARLRGEITGIQVVHDGGGKKREEKWGVVAAEAVRAFTKMSKVVADADAGAGADVDADEMEE